MEVPEFIARAIAAQGKVTPEEVAEAVSSIDLDTVEPEPTPTPEEEQAMEQEQLDFGGDLCPTCGGTRHIFNRAGTEIPCPTCNALPSPDVNAPGQAHAPWRGAPETERQAAALQSVKSGTDRRKVLDYLWACGDDGATDEEIALALTMRHYTAAPRRTELRDAGWVEDSGRRRATTTGTAAAVWILTERGRAEYRSAA